MYNNYIESNNCIPSKYQLLKDNFCVCCQTLKTTNIYGYMVAQKKEDNDRVSSEQHHKGDKTYCDVV